MSLKTENLQQTQGANNALLVKAINGVSKSRRCNQRWVSNTCLCCPFHISRFLDISKISKVAVFSRGGSQPGTVGGLEGRGEGWRGGRKSTLSTLLSRQVSRNVQEVLCYLLRKVYTYSYYVSASLV